ncbi:50S ribosomal protein L18 [Sulfuracidifex tepidarius]|uniref:Large ribosomal subunit protein uL18 n=1 Tax=Sulfuracidifex tepidarius TaxID=1294262 RepID=A0A510E3P3_9CREN|nr:50S ribosomal protein L18 [Sulfuracidifex tepidarius]BBG24384.1 50S ribosomal protein L18 [Sulfuracidifex tepidarius]BBG27142.1 50S ribosomal protein L18 [Sulfuracidifex tepidarius]
MSKGANYNLKFRRRVEGKTNYYRRYIYVTTDAVREVVRLTNQHVIVQFYQIEEKGDKTIAAAHSIELVKKFGWKGDTDNTSATYLTGYLAGKRALKAGINEAVVDIGMFKPITGSRIFYAVKGSVDAGIQIPLGEVQIIEERIKGEHISEYAEKLEEENPELFNKIFSRYLKRGLNPKDLPSHFEEVFNKIKENGA